MTTFPTPVPIALDVDTSLGDIHIGAAATTETTVVVRPTDPRRAADIKDAEQTVVEHLPGRISVRTPRRYSLFGKGGSTSVRVTVPEGSTIHVRSAMAHVRTTGRLGAATIVLAMGDIRSDETAAARLSTRMGDVTVDRITGPATIATGSGAVRITEIDGTTSVKNSNGSTWIGSVSGDARVRAANGDVVIDAAGAGVDARSACGDVRVLAVARGAVTLHTAAGSVDVGVTEGTAAWLAVSTEYGRVSTALDPADAPGSTAETVEVRAHTDYGDISIHRA